MSRLVVESFTTTKALRIQSRRRAKQLFGSRGKSKYLRSLIARDLERGKK